MIPARQQAVSLAAHPYGPLHVDNLAVVEIPVTLPHGDEVLVRNTAFLVAPSIRPLLAADAVAEPGVPYPPVRVGDVLGGAAIGDVVAGALPVGTRVMHFFGWREYATVRAADCVLATPGLWGLGHGWTAYAALTRGAPVRHEDTVFIASAGGAIGSMAGQIARLLGAKRVIGSTSTREKAAWIVDELGYDTVVARSEGRFVEQLAAAAPDGIDVVIDTVGGAQLEAALSLVRDGGRVALIGTLHQDLALEEALVRVDAYRFLARRVTMRGYSADDDLAELPAWEARASVWQRDGMLRFPYAAIRGLDSAPRALVDASAGRYLGAVIVELV